MSIVELYPISSVVWSRIPTFPWWPCEVKAINEDKGSIELAPFQDDYIYSEDKTNNVKPFAGEETRELVARGKKKLKNKSETLQQFNNAIQDAVEHIQSRDPDFTLGFDPFLDASVLLSDISQISTPGASGDIPALDSSIFTTGSCSESDRSKQTGSGQRTAATQSTPILGESRPKQEEVLLSDILPKVCGVGERNGQNKRKRRTGGEPQEENWRESGEEEDRHCKAKRKRSLKGKERMNAKKKGAGGKRKQKEKQPSGQKVGVNASSGDELTGGYATVTRRLSYDTVPDDVCQAPKTKPKKKKVKQNGQSSSFPSRSNATPPSSTTLQPHYPIAESSGCNDPEESERLRTSPPERRRTSPPERRRTSPPERRRTSPPERLRTSPSEQRRTSPSEQRRTSPPERRRTSLSERRRTPPPRQDWPSEPNPECEVSALPLQVAAVSSSEDRSLSGSSQDGNSAQAKSKGDLPESTDVASTSGVAFESSLMFSGVGGRGHGGGDSDDEMRETSSEGSSESEDDLPAIDMAVKESISVSELAPNDIIWAKYDRFPHWPALVVSVTPKSKTRKRRSVLSNPKKPKPRVVFFGYDDTSVAISTPKNIAPFGTKDTEVFLERGRAQAAPVRKMFTMAVDEARRLLRSRADKEISGSPKEQLKKIIEARPKSHTTTQSPMVIRKKQLRTEESPPTVSAFGYQLDNVQAMLMKEPSFDESSESESSEEEESSLYTLEAVMKSFQELKPILVDIVHEKQASEYHKIFVRGSRKDQRTLKVVGKFGPINRWSETKKLKLMKFLEQVAREETNQLLQFTYALDVLLPEAMIRTMIKFEHISWDEALEKL